MFHYVYVLMRKDMPVILIPRAPEAIPTIMGGERFYQPANEDVIHTNSRA